MVIMNFFIRIIGFSYDIILSKFLGAEAMGLFHIAMSTMMTFLIITTGGIPTSVSKLVAEQNSKRNHYGVEKIYRLAIWFNFLLSIVLSIIMISSARLIAIKIFKDKDMVIGVYLLAPAIVIHSLSAVLKSYYYGMKNVITPGISQIIEHLTRFIFVIGILYFTYPMSPIYGAMVAIFGISIGEFFDLIWSFNAKQKLYKDGNKRLSKKGNEFSVLFKLLSMAIPLTVSGFFGVILRFSNTILIPGRLIASGYSSSQSIATFGRITGMTMPLIHLPFIVTSALVVNLIPSLSEQMALKRYKEIKVDIELALKVTLLVAIPLTFIYVTLSKPLANFLYTDPEVAKFIQIMGYGTVLIALRHTLSGVLYGLNKQVNATINRLIGMVLQLSIVYFLVGNPKFRIYGYFIGYFSSLFITLILDIFSLRRLISCKFNYIDILGKPLFASSFMVGFIYMTTYDMSYLHNIGSFSFVYGLLAGGISYIFILVLTKAIPKNFIKRSFIRKS